MKLVSLIGAGPGDPELITVRGLKRLQAADVVIHDNLAGEALLAFRRPDAELHNVGKRGGGHSAAQEAINTLLVEKARAGKRVARLKGGDPLVFGRGGEEIAALLQAGVDFEIIPGVTAASAAGAAAAIPLTHRGMASGVLFLTGHGAGGDTASVEWERVATLGVTVCVYMGVKNLPVIARRLLAGGMLPEMPLALVSKASLPGECVSRTSVGAVAACGLGEWNVETPALAFIGDVAGLSGDPCQLASPSVAAA